MKYWKIFKNEYWSRDLSHLKVEEGQIVTIEGIIRPCVRGIHASKKLRDAYYYTTGPIENFIITQVEPIGQVIEDDDKVCMQGVEVGRPVKLQPIMEEWIGHPIEDIDTLDDELEWNEPRWNVLEQMVLKAMEVS